MRVVREYQYPWFSSWYGIKSVPVRRAFEAYSPHARPGDRGCRWNIARRARDIYASENRHEYR